MKDSAHATEIARLVLRHIEREPARLVRRLLLPQLRWLAADPDAERARSLGVLTLVEEARDEHLAALAADDGLAALTVTWQEVVLACASLAEPTRTLRCPRCGARLPRRRRVCSRCRLPCPR
jgi:hypothetical protein